MYDLVWLELFCPEVLPAWCGFMAYQPLYIIKCLIHFYTYIFDIDFLNTFRR